MLGSPPTAVNLPISFLLAYVTGIIASLSARAELRGTPRPALGTSGFRAFATYVLLVLVPSTVYFYAFHGDWFLLYLLDSTTVPSAVALLLFVVEAGVGAVGFVSGAHLVRMQRESLAIAIALLTTVVAVALLFALRDRVATVGTYAQFHGTFGLKPWVESPLLPAVVLFATILLVGLVHTCIRTHWGGRRVA